MEEITANGWETHRSKWWMLHCISTSAFNQHLRWNKAVWASKSVLWTPVLERDMSSSVLLSHFSHNPLPDTVPPRPCSPKETWIRDKLYVYVMTQLPNCRSLGPGQNVLFSYPLQFLTSRSCFLYACLPSVTIILERCVKIGKIRNCVD